MITTITNLSSTSNVKAKVEVYDGSTLVETCTCSDVLQNFKITRVGSTGKFFGFGVPHKLDAEFIDMDKQLALEKGNTIEIGVGDGTLFDYPYPTFYVTEVTVDQKTGSITVTAYDKLYQAATVVYDDLGINPPYTVRQLAEACAGALDLPLVIDTVTDGSFDVSHEEGGNFIGAEPLESVLTAIAEVTQTIYFINSENKLRFRRLDKTGSVTTITKDNYYELNTQTERQLTAICSATELGDNLQSGDDTGSVQYVRNNPLWDLHPNRAALIDTAIQSMTGFTIGQFDCDWVGNYLIEIGDRIGYVTDEDVTAYSYLLDDTITYTGSLSEITEWEYSADDGETSSNPTNIGERINQTFARVDKLGKRIDLMVSDVDDSKEQVSKLVVDTQGITSTVSSLQTTTTSALGALGESVETLTKEVNTKATSEEFEITIKSTLAQGVEKVVTAAKKYTFDDTGLNISNTENALSTTVNEDGMRVHRSGLEVLTADNEGVKAEDLHATTYLIIGDNSRLEDWQGVYTACFWMGG